MGQRSALDAYRHFFEAFNSRDVTVFSDALNYPHVRVSWRRDPVILSNAAEHTRNHSWDPIIKTGWDHTEALPPEVFFDSSKQAHISGGWTRFDRDGRAILVNRVVYIVTRVAAKTAIAPSGANNICSPMLARGPLNAPVLQARNTQIGGTPRTCNFAVSEER